MSTSRTEKLLTMLLLEQMSNAGQGRKVDVLSRAGLANSEIAELLGTTTGVVAQTIYMNKRATKPRAKTVAKRKAPKR